MQHATEKSSKKHIRLLKFIGILSLLWPLLIPIAPSILDISIASSLPLFLTISFILYIVLSSKIPRQSIAYALILFLSLAMISPFLTSTENDVLRSIKTFGSPALFFLFISLVYHLNQRNMLLLETIRKLFNIALIVSLFGFFEMLIRSYLPSISSIWYSFLTENSFAGIEYMKYGYMNYGWIFNGQRPLGLYGDMHTPPLLAAVCAVYFSASGNNWKFILSILAIILTFRWTQFLIIPLLIYLHLNISKSRIIFTLALLLSIPFIYFLASYILNDSSGKVIANHLTNIFPDKISVSQIIFGFGYTGTVETSLGYSEIFIYKYIGFFGIAGLIYFLLISSLPILIKKNSLNNQTSKKHSPIRNSRTFLLLAIIPLLGTIHYNSFFNPSVAFLYSLVLITPFIKNSRP